MIHFSTFMIYILYINVQAKVSNNAPFGGTPSSMLVCTSIVCSCKHRLIKEIADDLCNNLYSTNDPSLGQNNNGLKCVIKESVYYANYEMHKNFHCQYSGAASFTYLSSVPKLVPLQNQCDLSNCEI